MLRSLLVRNYAIIDEIFIEWDDQLNIITGETGAGKSILLGALSLILGKRADTSVLFSLEEKCIVEAIFDISDYDLADFFEEADLEQFDEVIIRREIQQSGRSRAFINDSPVQLPVLKALTEQLVSLHGQKDSAEMNEQHFQMQVLDSMAQNTSALHQYQQAFTQWKADAARLASLRAEVEETTREQDLLQFEYEELEKVDPQKGEQEQIEQELGLLNQAEAIQEAVDESSRALEGDQFSVNSLLGRCISQLSGLSASVPAIQKVLERLESARIELDDIRATMEELLSEVEMDEEKVESLTDRLNELNRLQQKHRLSSADELPDLLSQIGARLEASQTRTEELEKLEASLNNQEEALFKMARTLSAKRNEAIPGLESAIMQLLPEVGMPEGKIQIDLSTGEELGSSGLDKISYGFTANKGAPLQPMHRIASGGEISRLMLVIKSIIAGHMSLPTLIFDEVDAGISGETAMRVGRLMEGLGRKHQIICITHLPQMAGRGKAHFRIFKEEDAGRTITKMKRLDGDQRIEAIARMIGGETLSESSLSNARELLN